MDQLEVSYGLYLPPMGPFGDPSVLVDLAVRAEAAGWDGVFVWDHVLTDRPPIADTWTTLGAMASVTRAVRLGPMVTPLPRRRPWVVARQASTVNRLSAGRLILGVGLGSDETRDFSAFGEAGDDRARAAMLDEGLDIVRTLWAGRRFHHDGRHYQVDLAPSEPEPHPVPIWAASSTGRPSVLRRALGCEGIFHNPGHELVADEVRELRRALHAAGLAIDRSYDIAVRGNASPAWDQPKSVDLAGLAAAGMTWWLESLIHFDPLELSLQVVDAGPPRA